MNLSPSSSFSFVFVSMMVVITQAWVFFFESFCRTTLDTKNNSVMVVGTWAWPWVHFGLESKFKFCLFVVFSKFLAKLFSMLRIIRQCLEEWKLGLGLFIGSFFLRSSLSYFWHQKKFSDGCSNSNLGSCPFWTWIQI